MGSTLTGAARRRLTPFAILVGLSGSAVLGLGVTGTFSALTATVINSNNTAGTGSIVMTETDANGTGNVCVSTSGTDNSFTCTTNNKYGGNLAMTPGQTVTKTVRIYSTGSMTPASFSLTPSACALTNPNNFSGNICDSFKVTLTCTPYAGGSAGTATTVYTAQTLTQINTTGVKDLSACKPATSTAGSTTYAKLDFSVQLDSAAGNSVQGQSVTQPLTWQFSS
jgi:hypothetical protein